MRVSLAITGLVILLAAGCSRQDVSETSNSGTASGTPESAADVNASAPTARVETAEQGSLATRPPLADPLAPPREPGESPPDVSPDAAPDVAFGYSYSFGLAADQVAPVQQRHARLCEELGRERCQVTGMSYRRGNEDDVRAELRLALEPGLAHRFGERALDSVREAEGTLVDSQVTGTDVGSGIRASTRTIAELEDQLAELQERIARGGSASALQSLRAEADMIRERIRSLRNDRGDARERLATTPVTLSYASGAYVTGDPDFGRALDTAWDQLKWLGYGLFVLLMVLGPWALAAALIWLGVRSRRRRAASAPGVEA